MVDSREQPANAECFRQQYPDCRLSLGSFDHLVLERADEIILSPGVSGKEPCIRTASEHGVSVIGDIELFYREAKAPIIAITGTNAKSTVTTLVGNMAARSGRKVAVGGNLGTPALDLLDDTVELYVLELSSFQLETVNEFCADVAVLLNISPDHLDRYTAMDEYAEAKKRIFRGARQLVYNRDDQATSPVAPAEVERWSFGLDRSGPMAFGLIHHQGVSFLAVDDERLIPVSQLNLRGMHNIANSLAALAIGSAAGLAMHAMLDELKCFSGLPHRCQRIGTIGQVDYYNDSKGTNAGATLAAINGLCSESNKKVVLIAGGIAKESDFSDLQKAMMEYGRAVVLIGEAAPLLADWLGQAVDPLFADSLDQAVLIAERTAQPGDIVLLSPACASFDMFSNFEQRGEFFVQAVNDLAVKKGGFRCKRPGVKAMIPACLRLLWIIHYWFCWQA